MELTKVTPESIKNLPDEELLSLHRRCHQLFAQWRKRHDVTREEFPWRGAHRAIATELESRGMQHEEIAYLDKGAESEVAPWIVEAMKDAPEYVIVPQYVSLVGSAVTSEEPGDVDVVVRDDPDSMTSGWRDSVWVSIRDLLDPDKKLGVKPHLIVNPQGPMYFPPHHTYVGLFDLVLRPNMTVLTYPFAKEQFTPVHYFPPAKPYQGGRIQTDAFSPKEVWPWVERALSRGARVFAEPKYNGYHATLQKKGDRIAVFYEDKPHDRWPALLEGDPSLKAIEDLPDCILDCDVGIVDSAGRRLPRSGIAQLNADHPTLPEGGHIKITTWDLIYWEGESLADREFAERRAELEKHRDAIEKVGIDISPQVEIRTESDLEKAWKSPKFGQRYKSEGLMIKTSDWKYVAGTTDGMIKIKHVVELKAIVLDRVRTKADTWVYRCGLAVGQAPIANVVSGPDDKQYVDMGETMPSNIDMKPGDIGTFEIEELTYDSMKQTLYWQNASVIDRDDTRSSPYFATQAIDLARRGLVFHLLKAAGDEDEPTRGERSTANWDANWWKAMPLGEQKGLRFVLQVHWRGLSPEEAHMSLEELLRTNNSMHFDLRLETNRFHGWWGLTLYAGEPKDNYPKLKIERMLKDPEQRLEGTVKQFGTLDWLEVGKKEPLIVPPGTSPTDKAWSKFFAIDWGEWHLGMANRHAAEIWLKGEKGVVDGKYMWEYAYVPAGRTWLFVRPKDQEPFASRTSLEDAALHLIERGHTYLFWPTPAPDGPIRMYRLQRPDKYKIIKANEQRYTLGVAYPANSVDAHGDYMTAEELERAAWEFLEKCQRGEASIGLFHNPREQYRGKVVESYIWRGPDWEVNGQKVSNGDWLLGVIWDRDAWELIKAGKVRGYSMQGYALRQREKQADVNQDIGGERHAGS